MGRTQFLVGGAGMFSPYGDGNCISGGMMYLTRLSVMDPTLAATIEYDPHIHFLGGAQEFFWLR